MTCELWLDYIHNQSLTRMAAITPTLSKNKRRQPTLHIDMTPMVDLAFLLLTFFIMTTTLMKQSVLQIQQPMTNNEGERTEIEATRVLNLVLGKNDQVFWYVGRPGNEPSVTDCSSSGVRKLLMQKKDGIKDLYVFIKASDASRYQNIIDVLDEVMITGIINYSLQAPDAEDQKLLN